MQLLGEFIFDWKTNTDDEEGLLPKSLTSYCLDSCYQNMGKGLEVCMFGAYSCLKGVHRMEDLAYSTGRHTVLEYSTLRKMLCTPPQRLDC